MALTELERKRVEKLLQAFLEKRRPPPHIRPRVDLGARLSGQSVEIFEIRPRRDKPAEKLEHPIAKATYVRSRALWNVYWRRADLKWHRYDPVPQVGTLEKFVELVDEDKYACFFG